MEKAYSAVKQLVEDFKAQESAYLSPGYQESQVRQDFIDKFFTALGWDVRHEHQKNPYEQEVKIENKVKMGSTQRRADYAFSIAPTFKNIKFYVEAKKPSKDLGNAEDYHQTIRYGWNRGTPIGILTDFEEFHIIDCQYKPDLKTAMNHKLDYIHYSQYADEETFARIFHLFGREAVAANSIEKFVDTLPKLRGKAAKKGMKSGYQPVDEAFLEELDGYRENLAKAFKRTNEALQGEELTEAVQRTIDRLVFIRFLEDKQIEEEHNRHFLEKMGAGKSAWTQFLDVCKKLEPMYNGLVFKPHAILDSGKFQPPDDKAFAEICEELADPLSAYDFDLIPISILGSIYERFLGKVVHATDKRVKVEEKPEVRKAGGVYYTPEYIVHYIVKETVGKLIDGKTPKEIAEMAFADIACGSGSFLIEVYNQLLNYHTHYYIAHPDAAGKDDVFTRDGKLCLTLKKKKEILLNNIYGVDIDFQATEVTQLSLYLKMLEEATMNDTHQFGMFKETILPDLRQNIVCGNSLIGRDILDGSLFTDIDESKLKPMNFEDAFPNVMKRGGFDAVVGNPPYLFITELDERQKQYFFQKYYSSEYRFDIYGLFIEFSVRILLRVGGYLGYIIPHTLLSNDSFQKLRQLLLSESSLEKVIDIGPGVFINAKNETMVLLNRKGVTDVDEHRIEVILTTSKLFPEPTKTFFIPQSTWKSNPKFSWAIQVSLSEKIIVTKIENAWKKLGYYCTINQGLRTGDNEKYIAEISKSNKWKPAAGGKQVGRYEHLESGIFVYYQPSVLDAPRKREIFESKEKIVVQEIRNITLNRRIIAAYDNAQYYCLQSTNVINLREGFKILSPKYLLAILNSNPINFYFRQKFSGNNHIASNQLAEIPVPLTENINHDDIVKLVEQMLESKQKLAATKTEAETNRLEMQCASLDRQIDAAVYELYGLTEEEVRIVEG
jgi:type I restriction-modification system DNA methylase subunit